MRLSTGSGCASRQPTSKRRRAGACCEAATSGLSISVIVFKKSGATVLKDLLGREEVDVVTEKGVALVHQGSRLPGDRAAVSDDRGSTIQGSPNPVVPRSAALK